MNVSSLCFSQKKVYPPIHQCSLPHINGTHLSPAPSPECFQDSILAVFNLCLSPRTCWFLSIDSTDLECLKPTNAVASIIPDTSGHECIHSFIKPQLVSKNHQRVPKACKNDLRGPTPSKQ